MTEMYQTDTLTKEIDEDGICVVTLDRPEVMNALNGELVDWIWHTFYELAYEDEVRVVILTGAGEKAFCAGADLKERASMSELEVRKRIDDYGRSFGAVASLPKPVICAINGYAFGGGLELALAGPEAILRRVAEAVNAHQRLAFAVGAPVGLAGAGEIEPAQVRRAGNVRAAT